MLYDFSSWPYASLQEVLDGAMVMRLLRAPSVSVIDVLCNFLLKHGYSGAGEEVRVNYKRNLTYDTASLNACALPNLCSVCYCRMRTPTATPVSRAAATTSTLSSHKRCVQHMYRGAHTNLICVASLIGARTYLPAY